MLILLAVALASAGPSGNHDSDRPQASQPARERMLIVAPQAFRDVLLPFVAHKRQRFEAELLLLETALAENDGADDPERLKRALYNAWRSRGVRYVLLVGDADVMPVRYMVLDRATEPAFDYAFYPSDLYYADVARPDGSFDDWNARSDGFHRAYFGEVRGEKNKTDPINFDAVDYRPELALGRWPVSSPAEVRLVTEKTMRYEQGLAARTADARAAAVLVAVGGWVDSRGLMDGLADRLSQAWRIEKRYFTDAGRNDNTPPPSEPELVSLLNSGARLVLHTGHGHDHGWEGCLSVDGLNQLRNAATLPVVFSVGCSTARLATLPPYEGYLDLHGVEHLGTNNGQVFKAPPPPPAPYQKGRFNPSGLGEQMLRGTADGAVAYIGCNTGSQPCALTLLEGFVRSAERRPRGRVGDCWADALHHYYQAENLATIAPNESWYPASIFFQGMKFMLFGDPTVELTAGP